MAWFLTFIPVSMILWVHFRHQAKSEYFIRASNYWVLFYIASYFLPIPLFVAGEDAWTKIWGYSFEDFSQSLTYAVILATVGGLALSIAAGPRRRRQPAPPLAMVVRAGAKPGLGYQDVYKIKSSRIFALAAVVFGALFIGIELVGGLIQLITNLHDRITLFAGLNAFFLPLYLLIGTCFAMSAARATGGRVSSWAEWTAVGVTMLALFLLGSRSNIFILLLGVGIIKLMSRGGIKFRWVILAAVVFANLLMLYELIFREALIIGLDWDRLTLAGWSDYALLQLTGNFMQIQNLTVLVDAVPTVLPYSLGDTYVAVLSLIIPQSIIGVKPLGATGIYTLAFWSENVAGGTTTMPPGLFGEAYLNFGALGYLVLCVAVGLVLRRVDRRFQAGMRMNSMQIVSLAVFGAMSLHFIRGEFFSPFLIFVGIFIGARAVVARIRPRHA